MKPDHSIIVGLIIFSVFINACTKGSEEKAEIFSEARYSIEVTGNWSLPDLAVPAGAHFTSFAGMIHNKNTFLWQENKLASLGIENVAEVGNAAPILLEIDSIIASKEALSLVFFTAPGVTASKKANFYCNSNFTNISLISMIAPTRDWFIGLSGLNLYRNNQWISDTTINLFVYDAGTEDGDAFNYAGAPTTPQQTVRKLEATNATVLTNGNPTLKHIATVKLQKL